MIQNKQRKGLVAAGCVSMLLSLNGNPLPLLAAETETPEESQTLDGIDISNWQSDLSLDAVESDFVICKATGGVSWEDKSFERFAQEAKEQNKLFGFYHFAREEICPGTAEEEAIHFYTVVKDYLGWGIPVLDYEGEALEQGSQWAADFIHYFYSLSGVKPLLYTSAWVCRNQDWSVLKEEGVHLWLAQYADSDVVEGYQKDPWIDGLGLGAFDEYVMHQYTGNGKLDGYDGALDLDIFYGDENDWKALARADEVTTQVMYRLYNPNSGEHFYTAKSAEKNHLVSLGWQDEGIGWVAPVTGAPCFRLYNPNAGDHHYTLNAAEKDMLVSKGWQYEGIGWYSDPQERKPLYRSYNPNAVAGAHHYTTNKAEHQMLISIGWKDEGISWYGAGECEEELLEKNVYQSPNGIQNLDNYQEGYAHAGLTENGQR